MASGFFVAMDLHKNKLYSYRVVATIVDDIRCIIRNLLNSQNRAGRKRKMGDSDSG